MTVVATPSGTVDRPRVAAARRRRAGPRDSARHRRARRFVHLDYAASAPPLQAVADTVEAFLPWYSSVHRGAGFTSTVSSEALEAARRLVHTFVGARADDTVVFTRNTTDALNLLAGALPDGHHGRDARPRAPRQPAAVARSRSRAPRDAGVAHRTAGRVRRRHWHG